MPFLIASEDAEVVARLLSLSKWLEIVMARISGYQKKNSQGLFFYFKFYIWETSFENLFMFVITVGIIFICCIIGMLLSREVLEPM